MHGTRNTSRELGASDLATFAKVRWYAFPAGIMLQFTGIVCQGCRFAFRNSNLPFSGSARLGYPYYFDRLDEHWEKWAEIEMPLLKKKPSDLVRESKMYFSVEPGESQLVHTVITSAPSTLRYAPLGQRVPGKSEAPARSQRAVRRRQTKNSL